MNPAALRDRLEDGQVTIYLAAVVVAQTLVELVAELVFILALPSRGGRRKGANLLPTLPD